MHTDKFEVGEKKKGKMLVSLLAFKNFIIAEIKLYNLCVL